MKSEGREGDGGPRGVREASMSWKDHFGVWFMRGMGAALESERTGESGEGSRVCPPLTGVLGSP